MKAILIARVSTQEQADANNSLPAQIYRMKAYCERKSLDILKEFSFSESAYSDNREEFEKIVSYISSQKEKVAVCFDKVDRLSRNTLDSRVVALNKLIRDERIELHFVSDGQVLNNDKSASQKFQFNVNLSLASYYSDTISDNVRRAQEEILRMGNYPGKLPYGYERKPTERNHKNAEPKPYKSQVVRKAFELYATGAYSIKTLQAKLKSDYNITWATGYIDKILKNRFYAGQMTWNGRLYTHKYLPVITTSLFDQVQDIKSGHAKKKFKYKGKNYMYRGLLICAHCGITESEYHKYFDGYRNQIADIDGQLAILQDAEDSYYITAEYVLSLCQRAYELFLSSEIEQRRQIINLTLQNLRVEDRNVLFEGKKPFDKIAKYTDQQLWRALGNYVGTYFCQLSQTSSSAILI